MGRTQGWGDQTHPDLASHRAHEQDEPAHPRPGERVRAAGSRSTTNSVVLKCIEQTLRVLWVTGLGAVSRLEPGPASLSAAPQPPLCLKCCSWGRVPTPIPTATPVISQGLPCLGPLPGLTRGPAGQLCGGLVAPLWGGGPGEVARAPAGMGCGIY